ncbi:hypothetical protein VKT23_008452 [Stygiomarasmius scandens]|uniref:Uncharacterized protein n=1 Tax=Marasmiellus scandens TaxID=2682957 RepID=A0ABR1JLS8_9AGAR
MTNVATILEKRKGEESFPGKGQTLEGKQVADPASDTSSHANTQAAAFLTDAERFVLDSVKMENIEESVIQLGATETFCGKDDFFKDTEKILEGMKHSTSTTSSNQNEPSQSRQTPNATFFESASQFAMRNTIARNVQGDQITMHSGATEAQIQAMARFQNKNGSKDN